MFAIAVAVGLTLELLPLILSINLSTGSLRMAKDGVIVKKLIAIPNFGSLDVLCTDKTGTLTEDRIALGHEICEKIHGCFWLNELNFRFCYLLCFI